MLIKYRLGNLGMKDARVNLKFVIFASAVQQTRNNRTLRRGRVRGATLCLGVLCTVMLAAATIMSIYCKIKCNNSKSTSYIDDIFMMHFPLKNALFC